MIIMSDDKISCANALYSQYPVYEHRLDIFVDRPWPIFFIKMKLPLPSPDISIRRAKML